MSHDVRQNSYFQKYDYCVDSSAECQSGKCANGWETHGRQRHCFSMKSLTWTQSKDESNHMRSDLAFKSSVMITSTSERLRFKLGS